MKTLIKILYFFLLFLTIILPQDRTITTKTGLAFSKIKLNNYLISIKNNHQTLINSTSVNQGNLDHIYKSDNSLFEDLQLEWNGTNWENDYRIYYLYDIYNNVIEERKQESWDGINWINRYRYLFYYDSNNNIIQRLEQTFGGINNWWNDYRIFYEYDVNNNLIEKVEQEWNMLDSSWANYFKTSFEYDANNNLIEELGGAWGGTSWVNGYKISNTYDVNNLLVYKLYQEFYLNWVNVYDGQYSYDVNNRLTEEFYRFWEENNWINDVKTIYSYDAASNLINILSQLWEENDWINWHQDLFIYNQNNKLIEWLTQNWDSTGWVGDYKEIYSYDSNNNIVEQTNQQWNGVEWSNVIYFSFIYDENNSLIEKLTQLWIDNTWVNWLKNIDFYEPIPLPSAPILIAPTNLSIIDSTGVLFVWHSSQPQIMGYWFEVDTTNQFTTSFIDSTLNDTTYIFNNLQTNKSYWWRVKAYNISGWSTFSEVWNFTTNIVSVDNDDEIPLEFSLLQNYPNPFNPRTLISYRLPVTSNVTLKVYDVLGNEIATLVNEEKPAGEYEVEFLPAASIMNPASGIYFYQLKAGIYNETKKMILLK